MWPVITLISALFAVMFATVYGLYMIITKALTEPTKYAYYRKITCHISANKLVKCIALSGERVPDRLKRNRMKEDGWFECTKEDYDRVMAKHARTAK